MNVSVLPRRMARWASACLMLVAMSATAAPQIPDFVYQGRLEQSGAPANGAFDLTFTLFDAPTAGNQVGVTIQQANFPVTDGLFSVSLAFPGAFTGTQLYLEVGVEGTPMLPRQAVSTAPVSQFSLSGSVSGPAGGDLTGNYPNPSIASLAVTSAKIASSAVTNSKIATDAITSSKIASGAVLADGIGTSAVTNSKIANDAVTSSKIATGAIGADALANGSVGTAKIANDSVTRGKIAGGYSNGSVAFNVGANDCNDYNLSIAGAELNDMLFFNLQSSATLSPNLLIMPIKVSSADTVLVRVCNVGNTAQSTGDVPIYLLTLR